MQLVNNGWIGSDPFNISAALSTNGTNISLARPITMTSQPTPVVVDSAISAIPPRQLNNLQPPPVAAQTENVPTPPCNTTHCVNLNISTAVLNTSDPGQSIAQPIATISQPTAPPPDLNKSSIAPYHQPIATTQQPNSSPSPVVFSSQQLTTTTQPLTALHPSTIQHYMSTGGHSIIAKSQHVPTTKPVSSTAIDGDQSSHVAAAAAQRASGGERVLLVKDSNNNLRLATMTTATNQAVQSVCVKKEDEGVA